jgi:hypothetical protein
MHASATPPRFVAHGDRMLQKCLLATDGINSQKTYSSLSDLKHRVSQKTRCTIQIDCQTSSQRRQWHPYPCCPCPCPLRRCYHRGVGRWVLPILVALHVLLVVERLRRGASAHPEHIPGQSWSYTYTRLTME